MLEVTFNLKEFFNSGYRAVVGTYPHAVMMKSKIRKELSAGKTVKLDCDDIEVIRRCFLEACFGELLCDIPLDDFTAKVKFVNMSSDVKQKIAQCYELRRTISSDDLFLRGIESM